MGEVELLLKSILKYVNEVCEATQEEISLAAVSRRYIKRYRALVKSGAVPPETELVDLLRSDKRFFVVLDHNRYLIAPAFDS